VRFEEPEAAVRGNVDPSAVEQVLDNLLSNATKFSNRGGTVEISVRRDDGARPPAVVLSVRDDGPGFSEEDREHLFERFVRLSARPTGGEPSTGLGLSIAKRLVELMGGEIALVSSPGQGAEFVVTLPALEASR
jgi:two-component system sensor histidine kinase/response regulator